MSQISQALHEIVPGSVVRMVRDYGNKWTDYMVCRVDAGKYNLICIWEYGDDEGSVGNRYFEHGMDLDRLIDKMVNEAPIVAVIKDWSKYSRLNN